jgi:hypothetical protein
VSTITSAFSRKTLNNRPHDDESFLARTRIGLRTLNHQAEQLWTFQRERDPSIPAAPQINEGIRRLPVGALAAHESVDALTDHSAQQAVLVTEVMVEGRRRDARRLADRARGEDTILFQEIGGGGQDLVFGGHGRSQREVLQASIAML